jgi:outer membrane receptor protein involved in Fe transport
MAYADSGDSLLSDSAVSISDSLSKSDSVLAKALSPKFPKNSYDTTNIVQLDRILVTASRRQRLLEASQSISIIRASDWAGTNKGIADVVAEQTGVQTRRYGGTGSFQTVSIRGVQGNEVLVLLDGIPLNSAMGGAVDLGAINPDRIAEIEVYKGITPGQFGGNALGGVINLKSKAAAVEDKSVVAQASLGAYGYHKYCAEVNHAYSDQFKIFGSLDYLHSENNWPYLDRNKTPYNPDDDKISIVENHQFNFFGARLHPSLGLSGGRVWSSGISYETSEVGIPASEGSTNRTAKHGQDVLVVTSRLSKQEPNDNFSMSLTPELGYVQWADNTFWTCLDQSMGTSHGGITSSPNSYGESRSNLHILHASCIADVFCTENLGGEITVQGKHSVISSTTHVSGFPHGDWPGNSQELALSADINGSLPVGAFRCGATAGSGVKAIRSATAGGRNEALEMTVQPADTIEYPWAVHGGVHIGLEKKLNLFANAARYSNIPSLRDKYGTNGAVIPNPDLQEETGITFEAGIRLLLERFFMEAVAFRTEMKNGIIMLSDGNMTKPVNLAGSLSSGLEMTLWVQPFSFLRTEFRGTWQKTENRYRLYNYYGKQLPNEPALSALGKFSLGPVRGVELHYWADYKSVFFRDYGNTQRVPDDPNKPGMVFHNAQILWKAPQHLELGLSIRNFNGASLRYEELARSYESGYSWILYPANEWCISATYSF